MTANRQMIVLFLIVSTIWGSTWLATKIGVQEVPPLFFSASRQLLAAVILLALAAMQGSIAWPAGQGWRVAGLSILVATIPYALLFWGVAHAPSGLAAVVNLALMPLSLFLIGLLFGEEVYSHRKAVGVGVGIFGLFVLFIPKLTADSVPPSLWGLAAVAAGTFAYCLGSVMSRPLLKQSTPLIMSGWFLLIGGGFLLAIALVVEPIDRAVLHAFARTDVLISWLYLAIGGMVVGFALYTKLMRDWGPSRAGLYAFVSPVIAVALGVVVLQETIGAVEIIGGLIMFAAAALVIHTPRSKEVAV